MKIYVEGRFPECCCECPCATDEQCNLLHVYFLEENCARFTEKLKHCPLCSLEEYDKLFETALDLASEEYKHHKAAIISEFGDDSEEEYAELEKENPKDRWLQLSREKLKCL